MKQAVVADGHAAGADETAIHSDIRFENHLVITLDAPVDPGAGADQQSAPRHHTTSDNFPWFDFMVPVN